MYAALVMTALVVGTQGVRGQFSMNSVARGGSVEVDMPVEQGAIDGHVINRAEERVIRRQVWNSKNNVEFRASLTGMATQFNKSWTTDNQNSISSELSVNYYHTYTKDRYISRFRFDGIYGMNFIDDAWFKNQDMLKLEYLMSWKMTERGSLRNWAYSFETLFASQFAEGYKSRTEKVLWSNFMAPGTLRAGLGVTYTSPSSKLPFVVTLGLLSGNGLFVLDNGLSDERRLKLGIPDVRRADGTLPHYKIEGGSSINIGFNRTFALSGRAQGRTLQYVGTLSSFYGWMTQVARHKPVAVVGSETGVSESGAAVALPAILPTAEWTNRFVFVPLKFLSLEFRTVTRYDRSQVDQMQMQYYVRVGLTYGYKNR
jgi:hypothetical protein